MTSSNISPIFILLTILVFPLPAFFFGCKNEPTHKVSVSSITISQAKTLDAPSGIIQSIRYVPLETAPACLISEVLKLHLQHDRIYVLNNIHPDRSLIVFDNKGELQFKAGNTEGPGKVLRCNDFWVDDATGNIDLLDSYQKKLIRFGKNGNYIGTVSTQHGFEQIRKLPSGNYACYSGSEFIEGGNTKLIHLTNNDFDLKESFISAILPNYPTSMAATFSNNNQYPIYYWQRFSNKVWQIDETGMKPFSVLDFGNNWIDEATLTKLASIENPGEMVSLLNGSPLVNGISSFNIVGDCQFFTYYQKGKLHWNLYNPQSKDLKSISLAYDQPIANGIDGGMVPFAPFTVFGDELVFLMEPKQLLDFVNKQSSEQQTLQSPAMRDLLKSAQPNDNAIVVFVKLKC
jgi:6-bladed beta-propeller